MKYVLLGTLNADWVARQSERTEAARVKAGELGVSIESVYYTHGVYDFVDVVDADHAEAVLAFSVWYARHGYGRVVTMPAFNEAVMEAALNRAS